MSNELTRPTDAAALIATLRDTVGETHVVTDPAMTAASSTDWTGRFRANALCVVRPGTAAQAAACLAACAEAGFGVTPQGGNTGLVGGGVPVDGGVVLHTARLQTLRPVAADGTVVVGAGVTLAELQAHAAAAGWAFGVDIASRHSATVGGMVATDAGGARVVLHGSMRSQVLGLEVAFADGSVAAPWLDGAVKDTAGYPLHHLLVGSEGTLGVVTAAKLRLVPAAVADVTLLLGVAAATAITPVVDALRAAAAAHGARIAACELLDAAGLAAAAAQLGVPVPVTSPLALLVETLGGTAGDALVTALAELASSTDVVVALDASDRRRLWELRERQAEVVNTLGVPVKLDVAVPPARFGELLEQAAIVTSAAVPGARTVLYGHAAEANVHVNVLLPSSGSADRPTARDAEAVEEAVLTLVERLGGTISAEHGVGREKVLHLHRTRDVGTVNAMRTIKDALDPAGVMNPGVVLPDRRAARS